jgi:hypothetical protein
MTTVKFENQNELDAFKTWGTDSDRWDAVVDICERHEVGVGPEVVCQEVRFDAINELKNTIFVMARVNREFGNLNRRSARKVAAALVEMFEDDLEIDG